MCLSNQPQSRPMCIRLAHDQRHWKTDGRGNRVSVNTHWERKADWHVTEGKGRQREGKKCVCVRKADWHVTQGKGRQREEKKCVCEES